MDKPCRALCGLYKEGLKPDDVLLDLFGNPVLDPYGEYILLDGNGKPRSPDGRQFLLNENGQLLKGPNDKPIVIGNDGKTVTYDGKPISIDDDGNTILDVENKVPIVSGTTGSKPEELGVKDEPKTSNLDEIKQPMLGHDRLSRIPEPPPKSN